MFLTKLHFGTAVALCACLIGGFCTSLGIGQDAKPKPSNWGGGVLMDVDANGKLDLEIKSEAPAGWGGGGGKDYELSVDRTVKHGGKASASIKSITAQPTWYGAFTQAFQADNYRGQRLRMTAYVKSKDVEGSAGLWMRIESFDGKGNYSLSSDYMGDRSIKGTNDWKQYEVVLDVPNEGSAAIYFGMLLAGKGQVWVDDFKLEAVAKTVKTTGRVREPVKSKDGLGKGLPKEPKNLDFEHGSDTQPNETPKEDGRTKAAAKHDFTNLQRLATALENYSYPEDSATRITVWCQGGGKGHSVQVMDPKTLDVAAACHYIVVGDSDKKRALRGLVWVDFTVLGG